VSGLVGRYLGRLKPLKSTKAKPQYSAADNPLFSVIVPVYNPPVEILRRTIQSVLNQTFSDFELILIDDASPNPDIRRTLRRAKASDARIVLIERLENGNIVKASNDGVAAAKGEFMALLDHDDELLPAALAQFADAIMENPQADYLYSDEVVLNQDGSEIATVRKPDWSPEYLRHLNYANHLSVLRTSVVREVGGFHTGYEGSQDHDLVLRVTERGGSVVHIPQVLYRWHQIPGSTAGRGEEKPYAWEAGQRAVAAHLTRLDIPAQVELGSDRGYYRVLREPLPEGMKVSVIIPIARAAEAAPMVLAGAHSVRRSTDEVIHRSNNPEATIRHLLDNGGHGNMEILIVDGTGSPDFAIKQISDLASNQLRVICVPATSNLPELYNAGAAEASGDILLLLDEGMQISSPTFISNLSAPLLEPEVGETGAKILSATGTIQQSGLYLSSLLPPTDFYRGQPATYPLLNTNREVSALSSGVIAVRRETYQRLGGFNSALPTCYDIEFSLKIRNLGLRCLWIANAIASVVKTLTPEIQYNPSELSSIVNNWNLPTADPYLTLPKVEPTPIVNKSEDTYQAGNIGTDFSDLKHIVSSIMPINRLLPVETNNNDHWWWLQTQTESFTITSSAPFHQVAGQLMTTGSDAQQARLDLIANTLHASQILNVAGSSSAPFSLTLPNSCQTATLTITPLTSPTTAPGDPRHLTVALLNPELMR